MVTTYKYNASKRVINLKITGTDQGTPVSTEYRYYRNSSGIITYYSIIDADLLALGIDSIRIDVHSSASKYTSYVTRLIVPGFILLDSSVFVYDGQGKIIREDLYESPSGTGNDYSSLSKANYSYTANGNISQFDYHEFDNTGAEVFWAMTKVGYDSKTNPMLFDNEAFPVGHYEWVCPNNFVNQQLSSSNGPSEDQTVTTTYTYNSNNRPVTGIIKVMPDNTTINLAFYYQ